MKWFHVFAPWALAACVVLCCSIASATNFGTLQDVDFGSLESFEPVEVDTDFADLSFDDLPADAQPTPYAEVHRILSELEPKPGETFVDFGCGYDARFCIAAASIYGVDAIGVELDPGRAESARRRVAALGLSDQIKIIEGDATAVDVDADVGVAFLWPETLEALKPNIEKLERFASVNHSVPGLKMEENGDAFVWTKPEDPPELQTVSIPFPEYASYNAPVCTKANCSMCNKIRANIAAKQKTTEPEPQQQARGRWVNVYCNGRVCRRVWQPF
jgi:hypothetical protein